jgi:MFS family permease
MSDPVARSRRRATWTVFASVALGSTALFAAFTAAPLAGAEITGSRSLSGIPGAAAVVGTALGSALLSRVMAGHGRRAGLRLGFALGVAGASGAMVGAGSARFDVLLAAMVLVGVGHAANGLGRFAAADMHVASRRAAVLGWVVWAGAIGAALGPSLLDPAEPIASGLGVGALGGGFVVALGFYGAASACALLLRPDPSAVAVDDTTAVPEEGSARLGAMLRLPHVRFALVAMVGGQVAMVLIMTMTPLHIAQAGHGLGAVGVVMSAHFLGMFALAPVIGRLVERAGSGSVITVGMVLLTGAAVGAALAPAHGGAALTVSLLLLGLGWSCGFVAGSALLTRGLLYGARVRLQGNVDALVWSSSAVASLGSGVLLDAYGFAVLCACAGAVALGVLAVVAARRSAVEPAGA